MGWLAWLVVVVGLGCYASEADESDAGCDLDSCVAACIADGHVGGACISAPPDGPAECACR